ncbi:hypothetical protein PG985_008978 [Apiospora marii]|uniref:Uncharacterized protein n=1 Tax=Apiospora marii TaxID=335849 RepID=A0ABR1RD08_9PEZI
MAQPNSHTGHLAIRSSDLTLNFAALVPFKELLCRRQSSFVPAGMTQTQDIAERHPVVLFGLLRAHRPFTEAQWLYSTVTRQWLQQPIAKSKKISKVKELIHVVLRARTIKRSTTGMAAQTHLGSLVDTWIGHVRRVDLTPIASNPTPDPRLVASWRRMQSRVDGDIRNTPHLIFGGNHHLANNQPTAIAMPPAAPIASASTAQATAAATATAASSSAAVASTGATQSAAPAAAVATTGSAQPSVSSFATATSTSTTQSDGLATVTAASAAEASTSTTQSAAQAAVVTTAGSAQSSVPSNVTATSTDTLQSDGLAHATAASPASGSSMNSGSEDTQGEDDDVVEMPLPTPVATETEPESNVASDLASATGSVSDSANNTIVDVTASGSVSPTASSTDKTERAQAEKQRSEDQK